MSDVKGLLSAIAKVSEAEGALDTGLVRVARPAAHILDSPAQPNTS